MDRAMLEEHLAIAERHIKQGMAIIARQSTLIQTLKLGRHNTGEAERLLTEFETLLAVHMQDRDRIAAELQKLRG